MAAKSRDELSNSRVIKGVRHPPCLSCRYSGLAWQLMLHLYERGIPSQTRELGSRNHRPQHSCLKRHAWRILGTAFSPMWSPGDEGELRHRGRECHLRVHIEGGQGIRGVS